MENLHTLWDAFYQSDDEDEELLAEGILLGALEADRLRRARRAETRMYLTRRELLPNPREGTPWQRLYENGSDRAFITCMGFDRATFQHILDGGFEAAWNYTPIPRPDTSSAGVPRLGRRSLDAAGALGLALHYLSSTIPETGLQQIFALIPTTVSRYVRFSLQILLEVLQDIPEATVRWPEGDEFELYSTHITGKYTLLTGAFGFCDGLKLLVMVSNDPDIENYTYNGWQHDHFESCVLVYSPLGKPILICIYRVLEFMSVL